MSRHDRSSTFKVLRASRRIREAPIRYIRYTTSVYIRYIAIWALGRYYTCADGGRIQCADGRVFFRHRRKFPPIDDRHRAIYQYNISLSSILQ